MRALLRFHLIAVLIACYLLLSCALEKEKKKEGGGESLRRKQKKVDGVVKVKRNQTVDGVVKVKRNQTVDGVVKVKRTQTVDVKRNDRKATAVPVNRKVNGAGRQRVGAGARKEPACAGLGGICQHERYICQGRYLQDKCSGARTQQCCMPVSAWSILCAGHYNNRVRACDVYGCGAFNSRRGEELHRAVDVVCDDYGIINAPFSGSLAGPVGRTGPGGTQYDGVKLLNDVHCVKIFNIRPYRFMGPVTQGEGLGYLLPMQDLFSGITSHMELQMCDGSDPSPFI